MGKELLEKNDCFSKLRGNDLKQMFFELQQMYLLYRSTLNIQQVESFGVEIEYENSIKLLNDIYTRYCLDNWTSKRDSTVSSGGEITSPILHDDLKSWQELKKYVIY